MQNQNMAAIIKTLKCIAFFSVFTLLMGSLKAINWNGMGGVGF